MSALGLDLSLTCSGIAFADATGLYTARVRSTGRAGATVNEQAERIHDAVAEVFVVALGRVTPGVVVIEAPSFGSLGGKAHERGGLWWGVAGLLDSYGLPIATVPPKTRAIYAVGHGKGQGTEGKREVKRAVIERYGDMPGADIPDDNVADAIVLAAMGCRWLGEPIDELPETHTRAMDSATWPYVSRFKRSAA